MAVTLGTSKGLYSPAFDRDGCGFGLIAHMDGEASHWLVDTAVASLQRLSHRGAIAADGKTGDGCGLLLKLPDAFFRKVAGQLQLQLAPRYAVGVVFLCRDRPTREAARQTLEEELRARGLEVAGWRPVPLNPAACGEEALRSLPVIEQVLVNAPGAGGIPLSDREPQGLCGRGHGTRLGSGGDRHRRRAAGGLGDAGLSGCLKRSRGGILPMCFLYALARHFTEKNHFTKLFRRHKV